MNIGICDDLLEEREQLKKIISSYDSSVSILEYSSGEELLYGLVCGVELDLLFLDIYMTGINGIQTATKMREHNIKIPTIFLTTSPDFSLSAYGVRAVGYLLKPVNYEQLEEYLKEYIIIENSTDDWVITSGQNILSLPIKQIAYCEQKRHYCEVHMENGTIHSVRMTFAEITKQLSFYKSIITCGSSHLINMPFIRTLNRQEVILIDGTILPIPRRSYGTFREAYLSFYKGDV